MVEDRFAYPKSQSPNTHTPSPHTQSTSPPTHKRTRKPLHSSPSHLPRGTSAYALAKYAEYQLRDLRQAEYYYTRAIHSGERVTSAIKDLASLLHQQGKTPEACKLLEENSQYFTYDHQKFTNLYNTLRKQVESSGKGHLATLKISGLSATATEIEVKSLFKNAMRIQEITFGSEIEDGKDNHYCIVRFNSHSSARKTLEGFTKWSSMKVEWIDTYGEVVGDAHYARQKIEEYRKKNPIFDFIMFDRDPKGYVLSLPIDGKGNGEKVSELGTEISDILGTALYSSIFVA